MHGQQNGSIRVSSSCILQETSLGTTAHEEIFTERRVPGEGHYGTWIKHRNKNRNIEGRRKERFTLPPKPSSKPGQPSRKMFLAHGRRRAKSAPDLATDPSTGLPQHQVASTALGGSQWAPENPDPGSPQHLFTSVTPESSCGPRQFPCCQAPRVLLLPWAPSLSWCLLGPATTNSFCSLRQLPWHQAPDRFPQTQGPGPPQLLPAPATLGGTNEARLPTRPGTGCLPGCQSPRELQQTWVPDHYHASRFAWHQGSGGFLRTQNGKE